MRTNAQVVVMVQTGKVVVDGLITWRVARSARSSKTYRKSEDRNSFGINVFTVLLHVLISFNEVVDEVVDDFSTKFLIVCVT